jgi:hypothetical protein
VNAQVRLLRGDSHYVAGVLALDWKLDKEEQELTALDIANRKMLLEKLLKASQAGKDELVQDLIRLGPPLPRVHLSPAVAPRLSGICVSIACWRLRSTRGCR